MNRRGELAPRARGEEKILSSERVMEEAGGGTVEQREKEKRNKEGRRKWDAAREAGEQARVDGRHTTTTVGPSPLRPLSASLRLSV